MPNTIFKKLCNPQPHDVAFNKLYLLNLITGKKHDSYYKASCNCSQTFVSIVEKLDDHERQVLIDAIERLQ